ncbi:MAG: hypothetical protein ACRDH2_15090 [Anaerolineales bacterium]
MDSVTPEKITIIEGPTPIFEQAPETWLPSLAEGPVLPQLALTRLRTFNGPAMVERCWKAWDQGRPVYLEYRDEEGQTQHDQILAARYTELPEGHMLLLYVRLN